MNRTRTVLYSASLGGATCPQLRHFSYFGGAPISAQEIHQT
jgi:hypothetical protein